MDSKSKRLIIIFFFLLLFVVVYLWFNYLILDDFEIEEGEDILNSQEALEL